MGKKKSTGPLSHVSVKKSGESIWGVAQGFLRHSDVNNMATLRSFSARRLRSTLGGYTQPLKDALHSIIVMNNALKGMPRVLQASLVVHEGRHVRQIARGALGPTVKNEMDALEYERAFLRVHRSIPAAVKRIDSINDQLRQLRKQPPESPPRIIVNKSADDWLTCGCIRKSSPDGYLMKVSMTLPSGSGTSLQEIGSVFVADGSSGEELRPRVAKAGPVLKLLCDRAVGKFGGTGRSRLDRIRKHYRRDSGVVVGQITEQRSED